MLANAELYSMDCWYATAKANKATEHTVCTAIDTEVSSLVRKHLTGEANKHDMRVL